MRYRLVIFDFDGTLADSFPSFVRIFNAAARRYRFRPIGAAEVEALRGYSSRELMRHTRVAPWKLPLIAAYYRREATRTLDEVRLFPGVEPMLRTLAGAGVRLAMVSSNSEANVRRVLGAEVAALFSDFECGSSLFGKAACFRRVLRRSGVPPAEALAVGDEIRDLEAACQAGIAFGAVSWGYTTPAALGAHTPAVLFSRVQEVMEAVLPGGAEQGRAAS